MAGRGVETRGSRRWVGWEQWHILTGCASSRSFSVDLPWADSLPERKSQFLLCTTPWIRSFLLISLNKRFRCFCFLFFKGLYPSKTSIGNWSNWVCMCLYKIYKLQMKLYRSFVISVDSSVLTPSSLPVCRYSSSKPPHVYIGSSHPDHSQILNHTVLSPGSRNFVENILLFYPQSMLHMDNLYPSFRSLFGVQAQEKTFHKCVSVVSHSVLYSVTIAFKTLCVIAQIL